MTVNYLGTAVSGKWCFPDDHKLGYANCFGPCICLHCAALKLCFCFRRDYLLLEMGLLKILSHITVKINKKSPLYINIV